MYALLPILENGSAQTLCFADAQDAENFKRFVDTYRVETKSGNGYDAYWLCSYHIIFTEAIPKNVKTLLNAGMVSYMIRSILLTRTEKKEAKPLDVMQGSRNGAIAFSFKS